MSLPRYLTKSRFKLALECPTKLFYSGKPEYANSSSDDEFLRALAEGGFQVGELAKLMHPGGIEVHASDHDEAVAHTAALLEREQVTIFEAAIRFDQLFVRIDILKKNGNHFDLIEVKAKSFDPANLQAFANANGKINSNFLPYLQDVAFQKFVLRAARPGCSISSYLMMADKSATATSGQVSQRFRICRDGSRTRVEVAPGTTLESIGAPLLTAVPVSMHVDDILGSPVTVGGSELLFADAIAMLAEHYQRDEKIAPVLGAHCGRCEFRTPAPDARSGFHACWTSVAGLADSDFAAGTVLDVWNLRGKDKLIGQGVYRLADISADDLKLTPGTRGLSRSERQLMQVTGQWPGGGDFHLDCEGVAR